MGETASKHEAGNGCFGTARARGVSEENTLDLPDSADKRSRRLESDMARDVAASAFLHGDRAAIGRDCDDRSVACFAFERSALTLGPRLNRCTVFVMRFAARGRGFQFELGGF